MDLRAMPLRDAIDALQLAGAQAFNHTGWGAYGITFSRGSGYGCLFEYPQSQRLGEPTPIFYSQSPTAEGRGTVRIIPWADLPADVLRRLIDKLAEATS